MSWIVAAHWIPWQLWWDWTCMGLTWVSIGVVAWSRQRVQRANTSLRRSMWSMQRTNMRLHRTLRESQRRNARLLEELLSRDAPFGPIEHVHLTPGLQLPDTPNYPNGGARNPADQRL